MLSTLPPSEELPKNRLEVLTRNGSRGGASRNGGLLQRFERLERERARSVAGLWRIGVLRQRRRAQRLRELGIERGRGLRRHRLWQRDGLGAEHRAVRRRGIFLRRRCRRRARFGSLRRCDRCEAITLHGAIDLGKIGGLVARRRLQRRIAADRAGDVAAVEAREANHRALRSRSADRPGEAVGGELYGGRSREHLLLPTLRDAGLARQQRGNVLIAGLSRHQCEDAETDAEGREPRALRMVTQQKHRYAHATLTLEKSSRSTSVQFDLSREYLI